MKRSKNVIVILFILSMGLILTACGSSGGIDGLNEVDYYLESQEY